MSYDEAPIADLDCGKARRKERHPAHTWWLQSSDDSPLNEQVWCGGFRATRDAAPEAPK